MGRREQKNRKRKAAAKSCQSLDRWVSKVSYWSVLDMMAGKRSKTRSQQNVTEEDDLEFVSLSHVKELLKLQESTISAMFRAHMEATNKRIDDILVKMNDIRHSL